MSQNTRHTGQVTLAERLAGLLVFRAVIVTLLLGSAVAVDAEALSSLSNPKNLTILALIVGTYMLTIVYAVALKHLDRLDLLAYVQIAGDMLVTTILVSVTGGLDSIFLFLFYLTIINAAVVTGRTAAMGAAGLTVALFVAMAMAARDVIALPGLDVSAVDRGLKTLVYEVGINSAAAVLVAVLAGYLAERLGEVTGELEKQQTNLEELKALNENILRSLSSGLLTVDARGRIIFFNRAAEAITGWRASEVYGEPFQEVFPELTEPIAEADALIAAGQDGREPRFEGPFERPDGQAVYLGFSVSVLRDARRNDAGRIVIFQDLSEVKRLEVEKKRSERLAAVGQLAAAIAHEIRNPLASISGSVEMLSETSTAEDAALMRIILREVERLDRLITSFLDYSRPRALELEDVDLVELIDDVLDLFNNRPATADVDTRFVHQLDEASLDEPSPGKTSAGVARVDREAFRQVVWNLLNNAAEAMEAAGCERPRIRVELGVRNGSVVLCVEDDGPGISAEVADHVFEPFFTTKEKGTGLGLATLYRLVEEHGGRVELGEAETLGGARFAISVPSAGVADAAPTPLLPSEPREVSDR